jgi:hypothetical protein
VQADRDDPVGVSSKATVTGTGLPARPLPAFEGPGRAARRRSQAPRHLDPPLRHARSAQEAGEAVAPTPTRFVTASATVRLAHARVAGAAPASVCRCGRLDDPLGHTRAGRGPGVRQRAIGSRLAPASVEQRCRRYRVPCNSALQPGWVASANALAQSPACATRPYRCVSAPSREPSGPLTPRRVAAWR